MNYIVSTESPEKHFIHFKGTVDSGEDNYLVFQLPVWRPGRYAKQNYVENIYDLKFLDENGKELTYKKVNSNRWKVETSNTQKVIFSYQYFSNVFDGGSCFLNEEELYINPVNCFFYVEGREETPFEIKLLVPEDYVVATGLKHGGENKYVTKNFDELADCPIMASSNLVKLQYEVNNVLFNIWLSGEHKLNHETLVLQFKEFTKEQISIFGDFPVDEYHFLIKILPDRAYHGVEHCNSTVVVIGPSYSLLDDSFYKEHFLGVCSHELFHTWNVKSIRPKDYYPYDFSKENFSNLGYVAEGVTTYYGDLLLLRSGIISNKEFLEIFSKNVNNYFKNFGRTNLSLSESSFDTWVDGYVRNFPSRKVSIYNEGCLVTFMLDVDIISRTDGKKSFDDVMKVLFLRYGKKGIGFTEEEYKNVVEEVTNHDYTGFFKKYIWGKEDYNVELTKSFELIGVQLKKEDSSLLGQLNFGLIMNPNQSNKILAIHPKSPLLKFGLVSGNDIIAINHKIINNNFEDWLKFYDGEKMVWTVRKNGCTFDLEIIKSEEKLYSNYQLVLIDKPLNEQQHLFNFWLNRKQV